MTTTLTFKSTSFLNISNCSLFNYVPHKKSLDSLILILRIGSRKRLLIDSEYDNQYTYYHTIETRFQ